MGCGCNRGRGSSTRRHAIRPNIGPVRAGASSGQIQALGFQQNQSRKLDTDRRRIEKLRRQAIQRKFGK